jgi:hypothetical protein
MVDTANKNCQNNKRRWSFNKIKWSKSCEYEANTEEPLYNCKTEEVDEVSDFTSK